MKKILILVFILFQGFAQAQNGFVESLNGFKLGQFRSCVPNELGKALIHQTFPDGLEYEVYLLRPDTSLYMAFQYKKENPSVIWSIQISGRDFDPEFLNLKLGMKAAKVDEMLGMADNRMLVDGVGSRWEYNSRNYSFEIDSLLKLASIKINDEEEKIPSTQLAKKPGFPEFQKYLNAKNARELISHLSPDLQLQEKDSVYFFKYRFRNEVSEDKSGLFKKIFASFDDLRQIAPGDKEEYSEGPLLNVKQLPMYVIRFGPKHKVEELTFKNQFGRYLLWKIKLRGT